MSYGDLKKDELDDLARERNIEGRSKMDKDQLAQALTIDDQQRDPALAEPSSVEQNRDAKIEALEQRIESLESRLAALDSRTIGMTLIGGR